MLTAPSETTPDTRVPTQLPVEEYPFPPEKAPQIARECDSKWDLSFPLFTFLLGQ